MADNKQMYAVQAQKRSVKRRKKLSANLGLISAGTGLAALGAQGLSTNKSRELLPLGEIGAKRLKRSSAGLAAGAGLIGGISGLNNNLITRAEIDNKPVAVRVLNKPIEEQIPIKRRKVSKRDIRARRERRNTEIPKYAAIGSGVAGVGAVSSVIANRKSGVALKRVNTDLSNTSAEALKQHNDYSSAVMDEGKAKVERDVIPQKDITNRGPANKVVRNAQSRKYSHRGKAERLMSRATDLSDKSFKLTKIKTRSGKAAIALGGASGALGITSAITHRNNKTGLTRHRKEWWNG